jgi:N-acetylmuramoyl-L-alanine amidase
VQRARRQRAALAAGLTVVLAVVVVLVAACSGGGGGDGPNRTPAAGAATPGVQAVSPSLFSKGACVAMAPTHGNRHRTVFLDAGHGGIDPGAVGTTSAGATVEEAVETLPVELDAARLLRAAGYRVVVSRTAASSVVRLTPADLSDGVLSLQGAHDDVAARDICANLAHADALVGIYYDSGPTADNAGSVTAYDDARPFSAANQHLANLLQFDVLSAMNARGWGIPDGGVVPDSTVGSLVQTSSDSSLAVGAATYGHLLLLGPAMAGYFTTPSEMPGSVIEPLFITDPFEASLAASPLGQATIAAGIARAVEQFLAPPPARRTPARHPRH